MKISEPEADTLQAATAGDLAALDRLLAGIQPGVFNLALRMLGNREDAADATQETLLRVVTHLAGFRGEAAFATWVWRIARNVLLDARTRSAESPLVSLDAMAERLGAGLELAERLLHAQGGPLPLTPADKLQARQVALACTQAMLMTLPREQRLAYVLDTVFGLPSAQAAEVLDITPVAYRQRLARSRAALDGFARSTCGLANPQAACHCERQLPALRHAGGRSLPLAVHPAELQQAEQALAAFTRLADAAALFRGHPEYQAPSALLPAIRAVLAQEGFIASQRGPLQ
jgi:RNA polymerase sigma factor (sigma-70 family)